MLGCRQFWLPLLISWIFVPIYNSGRACPLPPRAANLSESAQAPASSDNWVSHSVAVVPLQFSDAEFNYDLEQLVELFQIGGSGVSIGGFFLASSHGNLRLNFDLNGDQSPDVFEPLSAKLSRFDPFDLQNWQIRAEAAAAANGLQPERYQHLFFIVPRESLLPMAGVTGSDCTSQIRCVSFISADNYLQQDVLVHELGHQLGMGHATDPIYGEYGDRSCPMGAAFVGWRHFNAPHQLQQGWLTPSAVREISSSGRYSIEALEYQPRSDLIPARTQVLVVPHPLFPFPLYVSYRAPADHYSVDLEDAYAWKVAVHTASPRNYTTLLDRLAWGQEFHAPDRGVGIKVVSWSKRAAEIEIQIEPPPLCDVQPARIDAWHWPGAYGTNDPAVPLGLDLTLFNQDRYCLNSSNYRATFALPSGWSVVRALPELILPLRSFARGSPAILPPHDISDGRYPISLNFDDSDQDQFLHPAVSTIFQIWIDRLPPERVAAIDSFIARAGSYIEINLEWNRPADSGSGVYFYEILRDGELVAELGNGEERPGFTEEFPAGLDAADYQIVARDLGGNRAAPSEAIRVFRPN